MQVFLVQWCSLVKALANEDTLLPTQMFPRLPVCATFATKCLPVCTAWKHNIHIVSRAFARPRNMIMSNNVSATMCPRLPGPLDRMRSEKPRIKRERKKLLDFVISGIINSSLLFSDPAELQRWMKFISCGYKKSIKNGCCKTKN